MQLFHNLKQLPAAVPRFVANTKKFLEYHEKVRDAREKKSPIAYFTYERAKRQFTWHPKAHVFVDESFPLSRKELNEYVWYGRDMLRALPATAPVVLGPVIGAGVLAGWLSNIGRLPSAFSEKKDVYEQKLEWYQKYGDELRLKRGPLLETRLVQLFKQYTMYTQVTVPNDMVPVLHNILFSHWTGAPRDVRQCAHLIHFNRPDSWIVLTNRDPVELPPEHVATWQEIHSGKYSAEEVVEKRRKLLQHLAREQELHGRNYEKYSVFENPEAPVLIGESEGDVIKHRELEGVAPFEELDYRGEMVYFPNDFVTGEEHWHVALGKLANEFLGLPWRFSSRSWNQRRRMNWYEQISQEDKLIEQEGGIQKLSDLELKVALLDRAVMRVDEDLPRDEMESRWKEINWLMQQKLPMAVILAWQAAFYRTTFSPESDIPGPSILPPINRTILDVDTHNPLAIEKLGHPVSYLHPAYYPDFEVTLKPELKALLSRK